MKIHVEDEKYRYSEEDGKDARPTLYMPLVVEAARSLIELRNTWQRILDEDNELTKYADSAYPLGILLEIDGVPYGTVRFIDDFPVFVEFTGQDRLVEEGE